MDSCNSQNMCQPCVNCRDQKSPVVQGVVKQPAEPQRKLFEIRVEVSYAVVIGAETKERALEHVKTWEHAWDSSADLLGVSPPEVVDVREPASQDRDVLEIEAHEVV